MSIVVDKDKLMSIVGAMSANGMIEQLTVGLEAGRVKAINSDIAGVVVVYGDFSRDVFSKYEIEERRDITFDVEKFLGILKHIGGGDIEIGVSEKEMSLTTESREFRIPLLEVHKKTDYSKIIKENAEGHPEIQFSFFEAGRVPKLKSNWLQGLSGVEETSFVVEDGRLFVQQSTRDGYNYKGTLVEGLDTEDSVKVLLNTKYLSNVFTAVMSAEVLLGLRNNEGLILADKTEDYTVISLLAGKIEV